MTNCLKQQLDLFEKDADFWWKTGGPFDLLHAMNPVRIEFILKHVNSIKNLRILDIGCGGGILAEALTRLGAQVTGIDTSPSAVECAINHVSHFDLSITYHVKTVEEFSKTLTPKTQFDLVIASEIIEHVPNPQEFLTAALSCLRDDNQGLVLSTLNKTIPSFLGAIVAAEYILRWVSKGTHEWNRFLKPSDISAILEKMSQCGQTPLYHWFDLCGLKLHPFKKKWSFTDNLMINYIGILKKANTEVSASF